AGAVPAAGGPAALPTAAAHPPPAGAHDLGSLSRRYESNGDPGTVSTGRGDHGGVSYGMYQFSSTQGSAREFVEGLRDTHPEHHAALAGLRPGTPEFGAAWRELAARDPDGFAAAQHDAVERTHYQPQLRATEARPPGLDFEERSPALRDVLWSTAVQHRGRTDDIFERALAGRDVTALTDAEIIRSVYAERGRGDGSAYFPSSSAAVRAGVVNRFRQEERDALAMLGQ
ncbi:peptidoglycan-binding protein, partial [Actinotalea ferrariae]|uniref:VgrG-related protein n=1 Tax=Actinotalea ferrariae TaxID=1386098 RepID=UPI001C8CB6C3